MILIFWFSIALIIYCYFGYPLVLWILAKLKRMPVQKIFREPKVSIVISVWNEEGVIKDKLDNLLSLDYPTDKIEIIIGSDGSTDKTCNIIKSIGSSLVKLYEHSERRGKMATLNELVGHAKNDIIVFSDARQLFEKSAVRELVANFSDERVGCVSGELILSKKEGGTAKGLNLYWNYEKFIRSQETMVHSMLGATGAIYAIRKELFCEIPQNIVLDDMYVPLRIVQKGFRAVYDDAAKAFDEVADSPREEHRRKARTLFGNYQIFRVFWRMFNPIPTLEA